MVTDTRSRRRLVVAVLSAIVAVLVASPAAAEPGENDGTPNTLRDELEAVQVQLDRYYDLVRQRRAREEFGQDPDDTAMRSGKTVERYLQ